MKKALMGVGIRLRFALFAAAFFAIVGASMTASAANKFWSGAGGAGGTAGGAGTWDTTNAHFSNASGSGYTLIWNNGTNAGDTAVFDGTAASVTVGTVTVNSITFSPNPSAAYTLTGGTITFSGANPTITVNTTGTTNTTLTSVYTGSSQLTKMGAGRLELNASTNTLVGGYNIQQGFINLAAANRLGTTSQTIPVTTDADWFIFGGGGLTSSNGAAQDLGATRGITLAGNAYFGASAAANPVTISAPITGTGDINVASNTSAGSPLNATFASGGNWTLSNTGNNWTGNAIVSVGTLTLGAAGVIPDASNVTLNGGVLAMGTNSETVATVLVNSSSSSITGSGTLTGSSFDVRASNTTSTTGIQVPLAGTGAALTKTTSGTVLLGAVNTYTGDTTVSAGVLSVDADATLGNGAGTLKLSGGTLNTTASRAVADVIANPISMTASSTITTTSTASNVNFIFSSNTVGGTAGTLTLRNDGADAASDVFDPRFTGSGFDFTRPISMVDGLLASKTRLSTFNVTGTTNTFSGVISGTGSFRRSATSPDTGGDTILSGNNTYSGGTVITGGGIGFGSSTDAGLTQGPIGTGTLTVNNASASLFASGGSRVVSNPVVITSQVTFKGANDLEMSGTVDLGTASRTMTVTNTGSTILSGVISSGTGGAIVKQGGGVLTLTGANTYGTSGVTSTTVSAGKLLVNNTTGSGTGPGNVLVNGGTLGGTGSIAGSVTVSSGSLSPGASINVLGIGGSLSFTGGAFDYEINSNTATADLNNVTGNLSLSSVALNATDLGSSLLALGTKFTLINYGGTWDGGIFTGLPDHSTTLVIGSNRFAIEYADTTGGSNFGGGSVGGGSHYVTITAVPESSAFLTMSLCGIFAVAAVWMGKRYGVNAFKF